MFSVSRERRLHPKADVQNFAPLPGPRTVHLGASKNLKSWNSGILVVRVTGEDVRFPVFQFSALGRHPEILPRHGHGHDAAAIQCHHQVTRLRPTVVRSRAFSVWACRCPRTATPSPTRRLWCRLSFSSVNTKTQLVVLISKYKYKCVNSEVV